jgi:hypothetical protein
MSLPISGEAVVVAVAMTVDLEAQVVAVDSVELHSLYNPVK